MQIVITFSEHTELLQLAETSVRLFKKEEVSPMQYS